MQTKTKAYATVMVFFAFSLAMVTTATGAGSITLTPNAQGTGGVVSVSGTGFGATKAVSIGFGAALTITGETVIQVESGPGGTTRDYNCTYRPVKPGSYSLYALRNDGYSISYADDGAGRILNPDSGLYGTLDYASGSVHREGVTTIQANWVTTASYTSYQYNVTPAAGATTNSLGAFSTNITVPNLATIGNYNVTVIDSQGNMATATLNVPAIPEVLPFGVIMLLSSFAAIVGLRHFRKPPRILN